MQEIEHKALAVMGKVLGMGVANIPSNVSRENFLQWDSLAHMNLILALEDEFGVEFSDEEISSVASLETIIGLIKEKCS